MSGRDEAAACGPIGFALANAARAHRAVLQRLLEELGVYLGQELVLVDIAGNPSTTQAELVARLGVEQPTVAKTIGRMERSGLLIRTSDQRDRRQSRISLTLKGAGLVDGVRQAWVAADEAAAAKLTERERRAVVRLLTKLGVSEAFEAVAR